MNTVAMRVLIITAYYKPAYIYGGPVRSLSSLAEGLVQQGVSVSVFTTDANGTVRLDVTLRKPMIVDGVAVTYFPLAKRSYGTFYYSPELAQACRDRIEEYDLVLLESLWGHISIPAIATCKRKSIPYVMTPRGQLLPWSMGKKNLKKNLYLSLVARRHLNEAAAIRCTDPIEAKEVETFGFRAPTFVVPNSVDLARFESLPPRSQLRDRLGIPTKARILLFLGRLHHKKRPDIAIAALAATQDLPGETHLIVAGPDESGMGYTLRMQARKAGCEQRLHLVGLLPGDEVFQALAAADLLLMPSEPRSENFGMSAIEAMAAGVPVLVSDGVPVGVWAENAHAGRMIPCDIGLFAQVACELLANPTLLTSMAECGKILVSQRFDSASVAGQMVAQFRSIIDTGLLLSEHVTIDDKP